MTGPENKELVKILRDRIRERGKIPFAEFMDLVLYHPREGYYFSPRERIGPEGDYYTSPHVHPAFGQLLARQFHQMWEILDRPSPFTLGEWGAGKGLLCSDILTYCRSQFPDFFRDLFYVLGEVSPPSVEKQKSLISSFRGEGKIQWKDPETLLKGGETSTGCIFSNELIDAFPVHLLQREDRKLREVYVTCRDQSFQEILGAPSTPALEEYFSLYGAPLEEGRRGEANLKALDWVEGVNRTLRRGFV